MSREKMRTLPLKWVPLHLLDQAVCLWRVINPQGIISLESMMKPWSLTPGKTLFLHLADDFVQKWLSRSLWSVRERRLMLSWQRNTNYFPKRSMSLFLTSGMISPTFPKRVPCNFQEVIWYLYFDILFIFSERKCTTLQRKMKVYFIQLIIIYSPWCCFNALWTFFVFLEAECPQIQFWKAVLQDFLCYCLIRMNLCCIPNVQVSILDKSVKDV